MALAERFSGEIINGDALQLYEGLPIVTNKVSAEERKGVPHHLLGCVKLKEEPWTVGIFTAKASKIIEEIRARGNLPILVGGTHYYTQSLLFRDSMLQTEEDNMTAEEQEKKWPILGTSGEQMLEELRKADPQMAARWHPKDQRKIRRSLEIWLRTGRKASDIYREQRRSKEVGRKAKDGIPEPDRSVLDTSMDTQTSLRYSTLVFWVHADSDALKERLNKRVDSMIKDGLLSEIQSMHMTYLDQAVKGQNIDTTKGIWVAVGYKEFDAYLAAPRDNLPAKDLARLKDEGIEMTKVATRQYAKRQVRWIKLKLLSALRDASAANKIFLLDGTNLSNWSANVEQIACDLTEDFLVGRELPAPATLSVAAGAVFDADEGVPNDTSTVYARKCDTCGTTLMTERDIEQHLKSRKHRGLVKLAERGDYHCRNDPSRHRPSLVNEVDEFNLTS